MTETLYGPTPVVNAYRAMIAENVPADIQVTVAQKEVTDRHINLWPGVPEVEALALAGGLRATLSLNCTSIALTVNDARLIGDRVRWLIAGRGARGGLLRRLSGPGFTVIDVRSSGGHSDSAAGLGQWIETFDIVYDGQSSVLSES